MYQLQGCPPCGGVTARLCTASAKACAAGHRHQKLVTLEIRAGGSRCAAWAADATKQWLQSRPEDLLVVLLVLRRRSEQLQASGATGLGCNPSVVTNLDVAAPTLCFPFCRASAPARSTGHWLHTLVTLQLCWRSEHLSLHGLPRRKRSMQALWGKVLQRSLPSSVQVSLQR